MTKQMKMDLLKVLAIGLSVYALSVYFAVTNLFP